MTGAEVNRDPGQYSEASDERDAETICFLVDLLLLGRSVPFQAEASDAETNALALLSFVGRAMLGERPKDG
jgi:hypothetical protein